MELTNVDTRISTFLSTSYIYSYSESYTKPLKIFKRDKQRLNRTKLNFNHYKELWMKKFNLVEEYNELLEKFHYIESWLHEENPDDERFDGGYKKSLDWSVCIPFHPFGAGNRYKLDENLYEAIENPDYNFLNMKVKKFNENLYVKIQEPRHFKLNKVGKQPTNATSQCKRKIREMKTLWTNMEEISIEYEENEKQLEYIRANCAMYLREFFIIKNLSSKIGEFYLKAKYNPRTPIGKKFVESLYDENF